MLNLSNGGDHRKTIGAKSSRKSVTKSSQDLKLKYNFAVCKVSISN